METTPVLFAKDLVDRLQNGYLRLLEGYGDRRTENWFLMSSLQTVLTIIGIYLSICLIGPIIMSYRKAFQFQRLLVCYNFSLMALNFYIATELLYCAFYVERYNFFCQLVDTSDNPYATRIAKALWWYYFSKLIEFLDTFFFILRKKNNQLTFLHVYHHSTMFGLLWMEVRFVPGGSAVPGGVVNSYVHVVMYLYYGLSALGPNVQKFLWWKKYITIIQLIQFFIGLAGGSYTIYLNCKFTRWMQFLFVGYSTSFLVLFGNFYFFAYIKKDRERRRAAAALKKAEMNELPVKNGVVKNGTSKNGVHHRILSKEHQNQQQNGRISNGTAHYNGGINNGTVVRQRPHSVFANGDDPTLHAIDD